VERLQTVAGIVPDTIAVIRRMGMLLAEQHGTWQVGNFEACGWSSAPCSRRR